MTDTNHVPLSSQPLYVIKLGGSLLDLPDLPDRFNRLRDFLARNHSQKLLLVIGGGQAADKVREYDRLFHLDEDTGHQLAVHAMAFNAHCMARVLDNCQLAGDLKACEQAWKQNRVAVADPVAWLQTFDNNPLVILRRWSFTSDSIAAAMASQLGARGLILLKSTLPEGVKNVQQAADIGLVDSDFPVASLAVNQIEMVNMRSESCCSVMIPHANVSK